MRAPPPPALDGETFDLEPPGVRKVHVYAGRPHDAAGVAPLVLVHSVNAAGSGYEVKPIYDRFVPGRPTYALDLPGFGLSDRSDRQYTVRLMTDAVKAVVQEVRRRHGGTPVDCLGVSLGCEFVARAAAEDPGDYRRLVFVSPTGFMGSKRSDGLPGTNRGSDTAHAIVASSLLSNVLFDNLVRPPVIRWFLEKTWGAKDIDEGLWRYDVLTTRAPGAKHAPLWFLSGHLFSADIERVYLSLEHPIWVAHGVRGDFVDYRGLDRVRSHKNWSIDAYPTGALPHFEKPEMLEALERFLGSGR